MAMHDVMSSCCSTLIQTVIKTQALHRERETEWDRQTDRERDRDRETYIERDRERQ